MDTDELLRVVFDFLRTWRNQARSKIPTAWGRIYQDLRFPLIHQANMGWVTSVPDVGPAKILADLDDAFLGTEVLHRALLFEDARQAYAIQEELARRGYRPTGELALAKLGLPACIVNPEVAVRPGGDEAGMDDFRAIMRATEAGFGYGPQVIDQLWGIWRERSHQVGMRPFVAYLNGTPVGTISVWPRGPFAWIDDVATHPDFRMRGIARTMIFEACRQAAYAHCEWIVLIADMFDTPREMYKTLGFEPVGEVRGFLRE